MIIQKNMKKEIIIVLLSVFLIAGCSGLVTKECLYREGVNSVKSMGIMCNENGLNDCIKIKDNIEKFKSITTENLLCSSTKLKKIVNSNGGFVNCVTADDCYRVLAIQKPFDDFNVIVCEGEFCKTTVNYDSELSGMLKKESSSTESSEIPLAPIEEETITETSTDTNPIVVPTGCGDNICAEDENCANCEEDCGCAASVAYCNTTKQMCVPLSK